MMRQLRDCARCGLFNVRGGGPLSGGLSMAWVYSHALFCAQPHGDSPSRKAFFDALLFGCIPIVLDAAQPDARPRAPALPFSWALPWRNMSLLLSRHDWHYRLVAAVQAVPPHRIRAMQRAIAEAAHLVQWSLPGTPPHQPPQAGRKRAALRAASAGWVNADGRRCAEDAFDMLTLMLARKNKG